MYAYKEKYTLDFSNVTHYDEVHQIIKNELDFPDYYGENWSAFWDCLTEMADDEELLHIELIGVEKLQQKFPRALNKLLEILRRFKHFDGEEYYHMIKIEIVYRDARYELS